MVKRLATPAPAARFGRNRGGLRRVIWFTLRAQTYLTVTLLLALLGGTVFAWRQFQENTALRAAALGGDERAALEARLAEFRQRNYALQAELAALRAAPTAPVAETEAEKAAAKEKAAAEAAELLNRFATLTTDGGGEGGSRRDEDLELLAALADLPEFQRMLALQLRGKVDEKYAALFKRLKMSPQELTRLQTLLADRQSAFADAMMAARAQGLTGKDARQVANDVARATQKEINGSIKDLLGPQRFNQFQNYERTLPQRTTVDQLAQRLSYTTTPLTPRQQEQLVQVLATSAAAPKANAAAAAAGGAQKTRPAQPVAASPNALAGLGIGASASAPIVNAAVGQAQKFLSPQQVSALQQMQQEQKAQQTLSSLLRNGTVTPPAKTPNPANPANPAKPAKPAKPGK